MSPIDKAKKEAEKQLRLMAMREDKPYVATWRQNTKTFPGRVFVHFHLGFAPRLGQVSAAIAEIDAVLRLLEFAYGIDYRLQAALVTQGARNEPCFECGMPDTVLPSVAKIATHVE